MSLKPDSEKASFDKEPVYDAEIAPLIKQIIDVCKRNNIPMLATFVYGKGRDDDPGEIDFCTTYLHDCEAEPWAPPELVEALDIIRNGGSTRPKFAAFAITTTENKT